VKLKIKTLISGCPADLQVRYLPPNGVARGYAELLPGSTWPSTGREIGPSDLIGYEVEHQAELVEAVEGAILAQGVTE